MKVSHIFPLLFFVPVLIIKMAWPVEVKGKEEGEEIILEEVRVEGEAMVDEPIIRYPSKFLTVIETIDSAESVETVSEILQETVGVQVRSFGGLGSFSSLSIRGSSPSQVQVLVDGVPLNRARDSIVNIEDLPLGNVERIEVYRGFSPAQFGSAGIGGTVNLVTRRAETGGSNILGGSGGSFGTYRLHASRSQVFSKWDYFLYLNGKTSRGDFDFTHDHGTPDNPDDDKKEQRINNDFSSLDTSIRIGGYIQNWRCDILGHFFRKEEGLPGLDYHQAEEARYKNQRFISILKVRRIRPIAGFLNLSISADILRQEYKFNDTHGEIGVGSQKNKNITDSWGLHLEDTSYIGRWPQVVTVVLEGRHESFRPIYLLPERSEGPEQVRDGVTGIIQDEVQLLNKRLIFQPTLRYETYFNNFYGDPYFPWSRRAAEDKKTIGIFSPSMGASMEVMEGLTFKANVGRFSRVPTFAELFGDRGTIIGNTKLVPEKGLNADIGFSWHIKEWGILDGLRLEYSFFYSMADDLILFMQNSQNTMVAQNISRAGIKGHELSLNLVTQRILELSANYTFQDARDRSDITYWKGNRLPGRPVHELFLRPELLISRWARFYYEYTLIDDNYLDRANFYHVSSRHIHNLGLTVYPWWGHGTVPLALTFEVKNITNNQIYDYARYPLPGRSYFGTIRGRF